jgi:hypothetical protein
MTKTTHIQLTPLSPKADRSDPTIRLFEEAVLRLRGRWPATATGLCTDVNRLFGFGFGLGGTASRDRMLENRTAEALHLVEALYGPATAEEVRRSAEGGASHAPDDAPDSASRLLTKH